MVTAQRMQAAMAIHRLFLPEKETAWEDGLMMQIDRRETCHQWLVRGNANPAEPPIPACKNASTNGACLFLGRVTDPR
jgi:hypothetical protein